MPPPGYEPREFSLSLLVSAIIIIVIVIIIISLGGHPYFAVLGFGAILLE